MNIYYNKKVYSWEKVRTGRFFYLTYFQREISNYHNGSFVFILKNITYYDFIEFNKNNISFIDENLSNIFLLLFICCYSFKNAF